MYKYIMITLITATLALSGCGENTQSDSGGSNGSSTVNNGTCNNINPITGKCED